MSWINALKALFTAKKVHGVYTKLEKANTLSKRIEKKGDKIKPDDLKFFTNKNIEKARSELRDEQTKLTAALSAKVNWPADTSEDWLAKARKVVKANNGDVGAANSELDGHLRALRSYEAELNHLIAVLEKWKPTMNNNGRTALAISKYARNMSKVLRKLAQIPTVPSFAPQAKLGAYSQQLQTLAGEADTISDGYKRLLKRNGDHIREAQGLIKENKVFLDWNMKREFETDKSWL